jgi:hypothetical protein
VVFRRGEGLHRFSLASLSALAELHRLPTGGRPLGGIELHEAVYLAGRLMVPAIRRCGGQVEEELVADLLVADLM